MFDPGTLHSYFGRYIDRYVVGMHLTPTAKRGPYTRAQAAINAELLASSLEYADELTGDELTALHDTRAQLSESAAQWRAECPLRPEEAN